MSKEGLKLIIINICNNIIENKELLNSLDAAIGDGDHGTNMTRGSQAILDKLDTLIDLPPADLFNQMAMTLISTVGGASGPLYGTALMKIGMTLKGKEVDTETLIKAFQEAVEGIKMRGKSDYGCKTMLDVLIPAKDEFALIYKGDNLNKTFNSLAEIGKAGVEYTIGIVATKGRASYLGERSIGTADPGATSSSIILDSIANSLEGLGGE